MFLVFLKVKEWKKRTSGITLRAVKNKNNKLSSLVVMYKWKCKWFSQGKAEKKINKKINIVSHSSIYSDWIYRSFQMCTEMGAESFFFSLSFCSWRVQVFILFFSPLENCHNTLYAVLLYTRAPCYTIGWRFIATRCCTHTHTHTHSVKSARHFQTRNTSQTAVPVSLFYSFLQMHTEKGEGHASTCDAAFPTWLSVKVYSQTLFKKKHRNWRWINSNSNRGTSQLEKIKYLKNPTGVLFLYFSLLLPL